METVQQEDKREVKYYNLDTVISVDYRMNSIQATQFRIWTTALIKEYIIKGFAMDIFGHEKMTKYISAIK